VAEDDEEIPITSHESMFTRKKRLEWRLQAGGTFPHLDKSSGILGGHAKCNIRRGYGLSEEVEVHVTTAVISEVATPRCGCMSSMAEV
jgi:hypothetical protein